MKPQVSTARSHHKSMVGVGGGAESCTVSICLEQSWQLESSLALYRLHNALITRLYQSLMGVTSFCTKQSGVMMSLVC